ncbi:hypothetical protein BHE74_00050996 [Ensete ventricosum]|nr:hypothetical protein BHE74_00050996 [Ensete ventricosum]
MCQGWVDAVRGRSVSPIAPSLRVVFGEMDPRRRKAERVEHLLGLLKVRVLRGVNLAYRDARGSDPYVVLRMGSQVVVFLL